MLDNCNFNDTVYYCRTSKVISDFHALINHEGMINVGVKFIREFKKELAGAEHVKIGYSKKNNALTMHFLQHAGREEFTTLAAKISSSGGRINSATFIKNLQLDIAIINGYYNVTYMRTENLGNFFVIKLKTADNDIVENAREVLPENPPIVNDIPLEKITKAVKVAKDIKDAKKAKKLHSEDVKATAATKAPKVIIAQKRLTRNSGNI